MRLVSALSITRIFQIAPRSLSTTAMSAEEQTVVRENLAHLRSLVEENLAKSTATKRCELVAVSKTKPSELIKACYEVGQRHFGENYVQELEEKSAKLAEECPEIKWHYIGQIQSNKIGKIASSPGLFCVETLASRNHCELLDKEMRKQDKILRVLVQVNTSEEDQKSGLEPSEAKLLADLITTGCPNLRFAGFMTIGSFDHSQTVPNPDFDKLFQVRKEYAEAAGLQEDELELSMGMSDDFPTAIQQGSTSVRVGSKIFGPRLYKK